VAGPYRQGKERDVQGTEKFETYPGCGFVYGWGVFGLEYRHVRGGSPISPERHRAQRFPFVAGIQVTALDMEEHIAGYTDDLSVSGCFVVTRIPFVARTSVQLRILRRGVTFAAQGRVAYVQGNAGMGIAFTSIEANDVSILDGWLTELMGL